jgi:N-acyl-L-homoserine lactone synthetase
MEYRKGYLTFESTLMITKIANDTSEFEQIHRLNYRTFVEEIPQHAKNPEGMLVDRFHTKNTYIIAKRDDTVIGMVCFNLERPFSLDEKLPDLEKHLPPYQKLAEIRLLSVMPAERSTVVTYKMLQHLSKTLMEHEVDTAVISGFVRQIPMYSHIGFIPFGPITGSGPALFQPMYITIKNLYDGFRDNQP